MTGLMNNLNFISTPSSPWQTTLLNSFQEKGLPNRKDEAFKFTPIHQWYNDEWVQSHTEAPIQGARIVDTDFAQKFINDFKREEDPLLDLHLSQIKNFYHLEINDNNDKEIILKSLANSISNCCLLLEINSKCSIVEKHITEDQSFAQTSVFIKSNAEDAEYILQHSVPKNSFLQHWYYVKTSKEVKDFSLLQCSTNKGKSRVSPNFEITSETTTVNSHSFYYATEESHQDIYSRIFHLAPNTYSDQTVKGILKDSSKNIFTGKIYIDHQCSGVDANQYNKNLVFGEKAHALSQPQLEIYNHDVKCAHGSTTGQIDPNEVFYFMARGMSKKKATSMLLESYANEFFAKIKNSKIRSTLKQDYSNFSKDNV